MLVPDNCTDRLQPLDVAVVKECMRRQFHEWYSDKQLDDGKGNKTSVDLNMSVMKLFGVK